MKIGANDIKKDDILKINNILYRVTSYTHIKPGKGGAFMQTTLVRIDNGSKHEMRFRSEDKLDKLYVDKVNCSYGYTHNDQIVFYLPNGEDISVDASRFHGDDLFFVKECDDIELLLDKETNPDLPTVIAYNLPVVCILEVEDTDPVYNKSASARNKPALLGNGLKVFVPDYITKNTKIKIDTRTKEYIGRADE